LKNAIDRMGADLGIMELFEHQKQALASLMDGSDCLVVAPTGSGKTLIYAACAKHQPDLVILVCPLISLMRDQKKTLENYGLKVIQIDSHQNSDEQSAFWHDLADANIAIVSPERLSAPHMRQRILSERKVYLVAIDEAHCSVQWGAFFRPEYDRIGQYLDDFNPSRRLALTATANSIVQTRIIKSLGLRNPRVVSAKWQRNNLNVEFIHCTTQEKKLELLLASVLNSRHQAGIIYTATRKQCVQISQMLSNANLKHGVYHAGLTFRAREDVQSRFMRGELACLVATTAFGLGINRADVRYVFHFGLPKNLEQFYQEIGRAGRDGLPSRSILFYHKQDKHITRYIIQKSAPKTEVLKSVFGECFLQSLHPDPQLSSLHLDSQEEWEALRFLESSALIDPMTKLPKISQEDFDAFCVHKELQYSETIIAFEKLRTYVESGGIDGEL
jgi:ATP-dependent DNA helicase RecQ